MSELDSAIELSFRQLGYTSVKHEQREAVKAVLSGRDCFLSVPTGFGKSAVFQALPLCKAILRSGEELPGVQHGSLVLVISPLVSLMSDQIRKLHRLGITTVLRLTEDIRDDTLRNSSLTHVFCSPEALLCDKRRDLLLDDIFLKKIVAVVVDEAHCIVKWGDDFRTAYSAIGRLRSYLRSDTPFLALTATCTNASKTTICQSLHLNDPFIIAISPDRPNVRYSVLRTKARDVSIPFEGLLQELREKRCAMSKAIVFCRSIASCVKLYKYFLTQLRSESYEPIGARPSIEHRLFAMYHARVDEEDKEKIHSVFQPTDGNCRLIFSTIAFGMGVDIPDIRTVIHYGPPADTEDYLQECGRAGRDNQPSQAILYLYPGCLVGHIDKSMKMYCSLDNDKCRRQELLKYFPSTRTMRLNGKLHECCDLCTVQCQCDSCVEQKRESETVVTDILLSQTVTNQRMVSQQQKLLLKERLIELRRSLIVPIAANHLYVPQDIFCGLPLSVIDLIVDNCENIHSIHDLEDQCSIWYLSDVIMDIIDDVLN